jgi:hypothetical protein
MTTSCKSSTLGNSSRTSAGSSRVTVCGYADGLDEILKRIALGDPRPLTHAIKAIHPSRAHRPEAADRTSYDLNHRRCWGTKPHPTQSAACPSDYNPNTLDRSRYWIGVPQTFGSEMTATAASGGSGGCWGGRILGALNTPTHIPGARLQSALKEKWS